MGEKGKGSREKGSRKKDEKKRVEELAELSLLTSSIMHDIRGYLTSIKGNAEIGAHITVDDKAKDKFLKIIDLVNQLGGMIEAFRKLYKGEEDLDQEEFYITDSIEFARKLLINKLHNISLEVDVPRVKLKGMRKLLDQVFINLILNSAEALENSPKKIIKIWCEEKNDEILVYLADSGPGIPEKIRRKIFKPFFTTKEKGTGLGLYITNKIITKIGGKIRYIAPVEILKEQKNLDLGEKLKDMNTIFEIKLKLPVYKV